MPYDYYDAASDEMYGRIAEQLYPDHKAQAIGEYNADSLRAYYVDNPAVMQPAVEMLGEGKKLMAHGHYSAAVVFFVGSIELLLKATLLRPVVHGLVLHKGVADVIVEHATQQTGFERYGELLAKLFLELAGIDLKNVSRVGAGKALLAECKQLQVLRNGIVHRGETCGAQQAADAMDVVAAVYDDVVAPMLSKLGLKTLLAGDIVRRK